MKSSIISAIAVAGLLCVAVALSGCATLKNIINLGGYEAGAIGVTHMVPDTMGGYYIIH